MVRENTQERGFELCHSYFSAFQNLSVSISSKTFPSRLAQRIINQSITDNKGKQQMTQEIYPGSLQLATSSPWLYQDLIHYKVLSIGRTPPMSIIQDSSYEYYIRLLL